MSGETELPAALLVHDGELSDVCPMLSELGCRVVERSGPVPPEDSDVRWDVLVGSPARLRELPAQDAEHRPTRIAIVDGAQKLSSSELGDDGIDLMVRRPVHPSALHLLLLHALYRGPEKRDVKRVPVGGTVQFRSGGIRRENAVLTDLSLTGARLLVGQAVPRGAQVTLYLPGNLGGGRSLSLRCEVRRKTPGSADQFELGLAFEEISQRTRNHLEEIVAHYAMGPSLLDPHSSLEAQERSESATPGQSTPIDGDLVGIDEDSADDEDLLPVERRQGSRHSIGRRIIALGDEAARVLIGRDISLGGMRVEEDPSLKVGDRLQLALHVEARKDPLVVAAEVLRNDGPRGVVLTFDELSELAISHLKGMVSGLPILDMRDGSQDAAGLVVSQILDREDIE